MALNAFLVELGDETPWSKVVDATTAAVGVNGPNGSRLATVHAGQRAVGPIVAVLAGVPAGVARRARAVAATTPATGPAAKIAPARAARGPSVPTRIAAAAIARTELALAQLPSGQAGRPEIPRRPARIDNAGRRRGETVGRGLTANAVPKRVVPKRAVPKRVVPKRVLPNRAMRRRVVGGRVMTVRVAAAAKRADRSPAGRVVRNGRATNNGRVGCRRFPSPSSMRTSRGPSCHETRGQNCAPLRSRLPTWWRATWSWRAG